MGSSQRGACPLNAGFSDVLKASPAGNDAFTGAFSKNRIGRFSNNVQGTCKCKQSPVLKLLF